MFKKIFPDGLNQAPGIIISTLWVHCELIFKSSNVINLPLPSNWRRGRPPPPLGPLLAVGNRHLLEFNEFNYSTMGNES